MGFEVEDAVGSTFQPTINAAWAVIYDLIVVHP